mgnify:FL=1
MIKTSLTAAAFTLVTGLSHATTIPLDQPANFAISTQIVAETTRVEEVAYFCEWAWIYDYYGNWVTVWQCY